MSTPAGKGNQGWMAMSRLSTRKRAFLPDSKIWIWPSVVAAGKVQVIPAVKAVQDTQLPAGVKPQTSTAPECTYKALRSKVRKWTELCTLKDTPSLLASLPSLRGQNLPSLWLMQFPPLVRVPILATAPGHQLEFSGIRR